MRMSAVFNGDDIPAKRFEVNQLFTPSTPVTAAELFGGRSDQMLRINDTIAEPGRHAIIFGERGVGKTSLVQIVPFVVPAPRANVRYCRIQAFPNDNFHTLMTRIFRQIKFRADIGEGEKEYDATQTVVGDITPDDVVTQLTNFSLNDIPIMVIDEFNEILDAATPTLIANTIKALSDVGANVTMIIVGVADNVSQLIKEHKSIQRCTTEIPMPRMSNQELLDVLEPRLKQLGFTISGDAKWKIIGLAKGLPAYVHAMGKFSCMNALTFGGRSHLDEADIDGAIDEVILSSHQSFKDTYDSATRSNQPGNLLKQVLTACALAPTDEGGFFAAVSVKEPLSEILTRPVEIANFQNHLLAYIDPKRGAILKRKGEQRAYRYRFDQPAMQPYVLMRAIKEGILGLEAMQALSYPEQPELFST
jgi:Cdc6-like AAA superfamily ATPase